MSCQVVGIASSLFDLSFFGDGGSLHLQSVWRHSKRSCMVMGRDRCNIRSSGGGEDEGVDEKK